MTSLPLHLLSVIRDSSARLVVCHGRRFEVIYAELSRSAGYAFSVRSNTAKKLHTGLSFLFSFLHSNP